MTNLEEHQILSELALVISKLVQDRFVHEELEKRGSIYGHCAVACEAIYILTQCSDEFKGIKIKIQRLKPRTQYKDQPLHFRIYSEKLKTFYDPTSFQFTKTPFEEIYDVDSRDREFVRFHGFPSFRRNCPPYHTNRPATEFLLTQYAQLPS